MNNIKGISQYSSTQIQNIENKLNDINSRENERFEIINTHLYYIFWIDLVILSLSIIIALIAICYMSYHIIIHFTSNKKQTQHEDMML